MPVYMPVTSRAERNDKDKSKICHFKSLAADLLGTLLMARSGRSTRTVRMADRLALWPSSEYSITLETQSERRSDRGQK